tara:strand:+ start:10724 stop:11425 length:702 start_codon:yes stop_codon:yes gene_type:complete
MGYLNNTTVTVDAVLTKKGRQIISEGGNLNVSYFTLSDTGVDYTLWNPDHASGSAYYGEAIENLPQLEALPNGQYALRNKLVSLSRDTVAMPAMELEPSGPITFNTLSPKTITGTMLGYSSAAGGGGASSEGVHILIPDVNILNTTSGNAIDITGNALSFITDADIPTARLYEVMGPGPNYSFDLTPAGNLDTNQSMFVTVIHITTGTYTTLNVTVNANLQPETRTLQTQGQG